MSPGIGFIVFLASTLALLALVVVTGFRAQRRVHIALVVCTLASLGATVWYAYGLGRIYDIHRAGWITPLHLTLARVNTAAFLLPAITGVRTIFRPRTLQLHKWCAFAVLVMTIVTAITGTIMLLLAPHHGG